jgi:hypothetical protein
MLLLLKELPKPQDPRRDMGSSGRGGVNPAGMTDPQREEADSAVMPVMVRRVRCAVKVPRTELAGLSRGSGVIFRIPAGIGR